MSSATRIPASEHGINPREIDKKARTILNSLTDAGYEAYLVGGGVRDLLLGILPKDFDIATNATPEQIKQVLPSTRIIGRRFRLAHVHFGREYFEVATFRAPHDNSEKGQVGQHGRIIHDNVFGNLEEDAYRRDYSVNALFYDLQKAEVVDFVGGMADLEKRQLRMIGDPEVRYREDPVRMLRAIRFSTKLGLTIEANTEAPIKELSSLLENIAPARLFDEALKSKRIGLVRGDSGFYTESILSYLEEKSLSYIMAVRMYPNVKNTVGGLENWTELTKGIHLNEMMFGHIKGKPRRYIVVRKEIAIRPKDGGDAYAEPEEDGFDPVFEDVDRVGLDIELLRNVLDRVPGERSREHIDGMAGREYIYSVKAVTAYEAPQITGQRELSASLFIASNIDGQ